MTRDEIIKELNYKGKYTNDVKRRLKKLLKIYHPDNNKKDNKTIFTLYKIKKELEEGTLKYNKDNSINENKNYVNDNVTTNENVYTNFLQNMIEKLKEKRNLIDQEINALYEKFNRYNEKKNKKIDDFNKVYFEVDQLQRKIDKLLEINELDKLFGIIIIFLALAMFILKNISFIFVILIIIILECYSVRMRYLNYNYLSIRLEDLNKKLEQEQKELDEVENDIKKVEDEEIKLKKEKFKINNDIQFYKYEISKVNNKGKRKSRSKGKVYEKK